MTSKAQELHKGLVQCLTADKVDKIILAEVANKLIPDGNPDFASIIHYPMVKDLAKENFKLTVLFVTALVRDFCSSYNVVRNMNEDQIIEAAIQLVDEADNFRLEDFTMMFSLAKKGKLDVRIMDRIDIDVINKIWDAYYQMRVNAKYDLEEKQLQEEEGKVDDVQNIVGADAWTELLNKMKADYDDGRTGPAKMSGEEQLRAKKERIAHAAKQLWGDIPRGNE